MPLLVGVPRLAFKSRDLLFEGHILFETSGQIVARIASAEIDSTAIQAAANEPFQIEYRQGNYACGFSSKCKIESDLLANESALLLFIPLPGSISRRLDVQEKVTEHA